jgi:hypothetical protein
MYFVTKKLSLCVIFLVRASYFHKSIGGYHAAKPRKVQQLFDYQIAKNNMEI